jgi:hypothetical protein
MGELIALEKTFLRASKTQAQIVEILQLEQMFLHAINKKFDMAEILEREKMVHRDATMVADMADVLEQETLFEQYGGNARISAAGVDVAPDNQPAAKAELLQLNQAFLRPAQKEVDKAECLQLLKMFLRDAKTQNQTAEFLPAGANRGAQTAFILFSMFLDSRPVSAAHDVPTSINSRLEIRICKSKTPV